MKLKTNKMRKNKRKNKRIYGNLPSKFFDTREYKFLERIEIEDNELIMKHLGYV